MGALRISPQYTSLNWQALDANDPKDWSKAADVVRDRLEGRFLGFASNALKAKHSGFVVLAIDSLLAETIQQFKEGVTNGHRRSTEMVTRFLEGRRFQPDFDAKARKAFYLNIRCLPPSTSRGKGDVANPAKAGGSATTSRGWPGIYH
jgi:hypothetical protein